MTRAAVRVRLRCGCCGSDVGWGAAAAAAAVCGGGVETGVSSTVGRERIPPMLAKRDDERGATCAPPQTLASPPPGPELWGAELHLSSVCLFSTLLVPRECEKVEAGPGLKAISVDDGKSSLPILVKMANSSERAANDVVAMRGRMGGGGGAGGGPGGAAAGAGAGGK